MDLRKARDHFKHYFYRNSSKCFEEETTMTVLCLLLVYLQKHNNCYVDTGYSLIYPSHVAIPMYHILAAKQTNPPDIKFHTIKKDVSYRFWNPVSNGLMHKDGNIVTCKGGFDSNDSE